MESLSQWMELGIPIMICDLSHGYGGRTAQGSIRPILTYANGQAVAYCLLCDGHRSPEEKTVVIGYSEAAANGALLLESKYQLKEIAILTNGYKPQFTEETLKQLQKKHIVLRETPILEVLGEKETKKLSGFKLEDGSI
jgi:thioredoxin reductase (NADPH)